MARVLLQSTDQLAKTSSQSLKENIQSAANDLLSHSNVSREKSRTGSSFMTATASIPEDWTRRFDRRGNGRIRNGRPKFETRALPWFYFAVGFTLLVLLCLTKRSLSFSFVTKHPALTLCNFVQSGGLVRRTFMTASVVGTMGGPVCSDERDLRIRLSTS